MQIRNIHTILLLMVVIPTLSSCLSYEEELWVRRDGSGSVHFRIIVSQMLAEGLKKTKEISDLEESMTGKFHGIDGLRVTEAKTYERAGNFILAIKMAFDSWEHLKEVQLDKEDGGQDAPDFLGVVSLSNDEAGRLVFTRTVGVRKREDLGTDKKTPEENPFKALGAELMKGMFSGYTWRYTVHFPVNVVFANTADEDIDRENNTVTWKVSLGSVMNEPYTMTATLEPPGILMPYALIGVAVVAFIVVVAWRLRARSSSRSG